MQKLKKNHNAIYFVNKTFKEKKCLGAIKNLKTNQIVAYDLLSKFGSNLDLGGQFQQMTDGNFLWIIS